MFNTGESFKTKAYLPPERLRVAAVWAFGAASAALTTMSVIVDGLDARQVLLLAAGLAGVLGCAVYVVGAVHGHGREASESYRVGYDIGRLDAERDAAKVVDLRPCEVTCVHCGEVTPTRRPRSA